MTEITDKTSMLYWYPLTKFLPVPQPNTHLIALTKEEVSALYTIGFREQPSKKESKVLKKLIKKITSVARVYGYPFFLRSDLASAKHDYIDSCFVPLEINILDHLAEIAEFHLCAGVTGIPLKALAIRTLIDLDMAFTSHWGKLPIAPERRYFVRHGKLECHHPYWPEDAIIPNEDTPKNWKKLLKILNTPEENEEALLTKYSLEIAKVLEGYWSLDFAKAKDGQWYFIDCALGNVSFHPDCPYK